MNNKTTNSFRNRTNSHQIRKNQNITINGHGKRLVKLSQRSRVKVHRLIPIYPKFTFLNVLNIPF